MSSSARSTSSTWSSVISRTQPGQPLVDAQRILPPPIVLARAPIYAFRTCQHVFQDALLCRPCVHRHLADHHFSQSQSQQYPSSRSRLVVVSNACPQCCRRPKHPDHRFCSDTCGQSAARTAPELKYLEPNHELSVRIATQFVKYWRSVPRPKVLAVYMITWTEPYRRGFEQDSVEARGQFQRKGLFPGNEQKRFRSTNRACTLGERKNLYPCRNEACWLCETIRCGFKPHLERKRCIPWNGPGIRLGAGIYTSRSSSKADRYAVNVHDPNSSIRAMLVCRVVIGKPYATYDEDQMMKNPPPGYDCVYGEPGWQSAFAEDECVVYDADAIRAAYVVLYEKARDEEISA